MNISATGSSTLRGIDARGGRSLNVTGDTTIELSGDAGIYGISNYFNGGKELRFDGGFTLNMTNNTDYNVYLCGLLAYQSTTTFNGDTEITAASISTNDYTDGVFLECDADNAYDTTVDFNGDTTTIYVDAPLAYGVTASGGPGTINFNGDTVNITAKGDYLAVGMCSQYAAHINTSENTSLTVDLSSSAGDAIGIDLDNYGGSSYGYYNGNVSLGSGADIIVDAGGRLDDIARPHGQYRTRHKRDGRGRNNRGLPDAERSRE